MNDAERRAIEWECAQNTIRFYNRLDAVKGEEAALAFVEDGIWHKLNSDDGYKGREEIAAYANDVRGRGNPKYPEADRMVFHLVNNLEVIVHNENEAEVSAVLCVIPGARGANGAVGWTQGVSAISTTTEKYKRTAEGWRIVSKRTSPALRIQAPPA
jgi:hypothetical protein